MSMKREVRILSAAAALWVLAALPARAGWYIQEADPEFPEQVTSYVYQGQKVRVEGALEGLAMYLDVTADEGWLVDGPTKRYAGGKIADLVEQLKKLDTQEVQDAGGTPAEQGEAASPDQGSSSGPTEGPAAPPVVEIKDLGSGEPIIGFETRRYQVYADKELVEEVWIAPKVDVWREVDIERFSSAMQRMLGGGAQGAGYEENPDYRKLRRGGYPMRQVLYFVGEKSTLEVRKAEAKAVPAADLAVPAGLKKVGYLDLLVGTE